MKSFRRALPRVPLLLLLLPASLTAQPWRLGPPESVSASTGPFEILKGIESYQTGWELRFSPRRLPLPPRVPDLIPMTGAMASSRGELYVYGGLRLEIPLGSSRWVVSPGTAVGLYYRGYGKNLGGVLEFRSDLELAYRVTGDTRVGLCFFHLSNAGIFGFNPGTESLVLTYSASLRSRQDR